MTPKEKAKDLYLKMLSWQNESHYIERNIISISAKRSALIAVDEIIESEPSYTSSIFQGSFLKSDNTEYWQEVKQEIEKL
jgi:hypothetical protein